MPAHKGVEVWIEDSEHRKLNHQKVTINLVDADDRTVTVKTEMSRNEAYTVHCLSPTSVLCDVFVTTASRVRKCASRFYLDKGLAVSENALGSSINHVIGEFKDHELRTPKRQFQQGKLGIVEVEIRRIGKIVKGEPEPMEGHEVSEELEVDLVMIDEPEQIPWLIFRFDLCVKESLVAYTPTLEHVTRRAPRKIPVGQTIDTESNDEAPGEMSHGRLHKSRKRPREHECCDHSSSACRDPNPVDTNSDLLQQEYQKEEAEERRLLRRLQERLETKKARNEELRRILGETA